MSSDGIARYIVFRVYEAIGNDGTALHLVGSDPSTALCEHRPRRFHPFHGSPADDDICERCRIVARTLLRGRKPGYRGWAGGQLSRTVRR